ncbi:MAG: LytTR family DNA-binding domain-containing protein [Proteobacteria bacterium]|nr:LytTR family DNA-binding domain-containing protein [Pseudomonadota bacterium]
MNTIRSIIVEDEEASICMLRDELLPYKNIEVIAEYRNGREGLEGINKLRPDLVFVDIEMPGMDGFQMLQQLECNPAVIFCTGHQKYALEAWDYDATDFITKPIDPKRVAKALEKALDDIQHKRLENRLTQQKQFAGFIELQWIDASGKKTRFFSPDEINYIQGDRDYLKIFITDNVAQDLGLPENLLTIKKTMKWAVTELQKHDFVQIHKSYLVNLQKITEWNKTNREIRLKFQESALPIGRSYLKDFQKTWEEQLI